MSRVALIGSVVFAVLLPVLVWWASFVFARALSSFSAQMEIDRRLREDPGVRRKAIWMPWRREMIARERWRSMSPGPERDSLEALLRQHGRAMDMQAGVIALISAGLLVAPWTPSALHGGLAVLLLATVVWRWLARRA